MDRIEEIVKDIESLRADYNSCKKELDIYQNTNNPNNKSKKPYLNKEKINLVLIKEYEEKIKSKDKKIKSLENKISKMLVSKNIKQEVCKDDNPFPKLIMKETTEKEENFKASAFRLNIDSNIYDSINGKVVYKWESKTSFTSSVMTQKWIKITGYFTNKVWKKADEELWVKKTNTIKR
jgi:hypothetical protein